MVQGDAHVGTRSAVVLLAAFATVYLLVVLLRLEAGASVLAMGAVVALSVADHVRRTDRRAVNA